MARKKTSDFSTIEFTDIVASTMSLLKKIPRNLIGKDYAIGDIHGYFSLLESGLATIGFNPETDRLFATGDLVDRGPESSLVLEWLAKPWFHSVQGNHEDLAIRTMIDAFPRYDADNLWIQELIDEEKEVFMQAFGELPIAIKVETRQGWVGIVHADFPYDQWDDEQFKWWTAKDIEIAQWSIARLRHQYATPISGIRAVIHGHQTVNGVCQLGNVYFIDTKGGNQNTGYKLTLLDLESLEVRAQF